MLGLALETSEKNGLQLLLHCKPLKVYLGVNEIRLDFASLMNRSRFIGSDFGVKNWSLLFLFS